MEWIESQGGPLIVLEESLLPFWEGADPPSSRRAVRAESRVSGRDSATDYDRACDVRRAMGLIEVGPGFGLVIGGEPLPTTWLANDEGGMLVRWRYGAEDSVLQRMSEVTRAEFDEHALHHTVGGAVVLFDAAFPGHEILTPMLRIDLRPGDYEVRIAEWAPDDQTSLVLHRIART